MILLALLAQIGPAPTVAAPLPPEIAQRTRPPAVAAAAPSDLTGCLAGLAEDPLAVVDRATAWRDTATGRSRAEAGQCLGVALSALQRWQAALIAFTDARDALPAEEHAYRARLGALAGNAALAGGNPDAALAALDGATGDAALGSDKGLIGDIALDRARALVALGRPAEAEAPLAAARAALPDSAQAWLLSATLSRRLGKLAEAQAQIEEAGDLLPTAPDIGLEAGVIAVLSGRDVAARKSWQSVIDAAPTSAAATTARGYIAQLGQPVQAGS